MRNTGAVAAFLSAIFLASAACSSEGGGPVAVAEVSSTTTLERASTLVCVGEAGTHRIGRADGEPLVRAATTYAGADLNSVEIRPTVEAVEVVWHLAEVPAPTQSPQGADRSATLAIFFAVDDDPWAGGSLAATAYPDGHWYVRLTNSDGTHRIDTAPTIDGSKVTVIYPRDLMTSEHTHWFAFVEIEGEVLREHEGREVFERANDTCPASDEAIPQSSSWPPINLVRE